MSLLIPLKTVHHKESMEPVIARSYVLNKDSVEYYPLNEVMAAIAYHECGNLSQEERFLVMEAFLNRVEDNFNNNGNTVKGQLLAPKQFTGLWKYRPQDWKYDSTDDISVQNKEMADAIIKGYRISSDKRIYYWAGVVDRSKTHGKWVKKQKINTSPNVKHWFR